MGAEALGIYNNSDSVSVLLDCLRGKNHPPFLRDEIILAIAEIVDTQKKFYKILARYTASVGTTEVGTTEVGTTDNSLSDALIMDEVESTLEFVKTAMNRKKSKFTASVIETTAERYQTSVSKYIKEKDGADFSRWILELPDDYSRSRTPGKESIIKTVFSEAIIDEDLNSIDCLNLLIINWAAQELKIWAISIK